jgi:hypothetical protein
MNAPIEVWLIEPKRQVLVTDYPGPPGDITGFISEEARQAAQARGYATVSEIGFPSDAFLGRFDDWPAALEIANAKAAETGFKVMREDAFMDSFLESIDEQPDYDDDDDYEECDWDDDPDW